MKKNTDPRNLCTAYDLSDDEVKRFYRGAGRATVVLAAGNLIIGCFYHELGQLPDDDEARHSYIKKIYPLAARVMDGMMSCHAFCPDDQQ